MKKILFASDLDNTLLFSYKHKLDGDLCVEHLDGREQGFCTRMSLELLVSMWEKIRFIPVTTRSVAQYKRIAWPADCTPKYALTTNGGILLVNGTADEDWLEETRRLTSPWQEELLDLESRLPEAPVLKRFRIVDGLYLFAACDGADDARRGGDFFARKTALSIAVSGRKVYFFPPPLHKGTAVRRLKEKFQPGKTICAGDSAIDVPMFSEAELALMPEKAMGQRFPDFVIQSVWEVVQNER